MNGIYFTTMCNIKDPNDNINPGIKEKIRQQVELFEKNGIHIIFHYSSNNSKCYRYFNRLPFYKDKYDLSNKSIKEADFIYIRKPSAINNGFIDLLKRIKEVNPRIHVLLEIPTYPYDNEIQGLIRITLKIKDRIARCELYKYVDAIITYSKDKEIFGVKTINLCNGVNTEKIAADLRKYSHPNDGIVRIIACAKFNLWHGYDRAIEGLNNYVKDPNTQKNIEIEMVGDGASVKVYKRLVTKYALEKYVNFYGKLQESELVQVYSMSDIGLDSMGRHRSGVYYNSSLKGKEYCAYGLVIISGVETELDNDKSFKYYYRIPADDTPIDFKKVIEFYNLITDGGKEKDKIRNYIMDYAKANFSMEIVFQPVIEYINNLSKEI